jgi:hypothetical protein
MAAPTEGEKWGAGEGGNQEGALAVDQSEFVFLLKHKIAARISLLQPRSYPLQALAFA